MVASGLERCVSAEMTGTQGIGQGYWYKCTYLWVVYASMRIVAYTRDHHIPKNLSPFSTFVLLLSFVNRP